MKKKLIFAALIAFLLGGVGVGKKVLFHMNQMLLYTLQTPQQTDADGV